MINGRKSASVDSSHFYRNFTLVANHAPNAPTNLRTTIVGNDIKFKWDKSTDIETSQNGLNYNLYLYESGQNNFLRSPQSDTANGFHRIASIGNIQYDTNGYIIKGFFHNDRTYKWGVQAIDAGLKASAFSTPNTFPGFQILNEPSSITICPGKDTLFTLFASGNGLHYKWYRNNIEIPNSDSNNLAILNVSSSDTGMYFCKVFDSNDSIISDTVNLILNSNLPGIASQIIGATNICQGMNISYSTAPIPDVVSYIWTLPTGATGTSTTNNITVSYSATAQSGNITVIGTNTCGNGPASSLPVTILNVLPPPLDIISGLDSVFVDQENLQYSILPTPNTDSYIWTLPSGATGSSITDSILVSFIGNPQSGTISVKGHNVCGDGVVTTKVITIKSRFEVQTGISLPNVAQSSVAWGDYNNDGWLDLIITGYTGTSCISKIYKNNGDNTFAEQTGINLTGVCYGSVAWGDFNNDGWLDILLTGSTSYSNQTSNSEIYLNNRNGTFSKQNGISLIGVHQGSVVCGDYNNDGWLDILLTGVSASGQISKIYKNNGNNTFTEQTGIVLTGVYQSSVAFGDYNNDGWLDILLTGLNGTTRISKIYKNNGDNSFTEQTSIGLDSVFTCSVAWGDYNNDGYLDILLTGRGISSKIAKIFKNNGNNTFTQQTSILLTGVDYSSVAWGDYNNDGLLDILLTGSTGSVFISKLYKNNGNNTFTEQTGNLLTGVSGGSIAFGDYDNDGDLDILLTGNTNSTITTKIYKNKYTPQNNGPNAPSNLHSAIIGNDVSLKWDKAADIETPQMGLNYNLFLTEFGQNIYSRSPQSDTVNGFHRVATIGNIQYDTNGYILKGVIQPNKSYVWKVQAIDAGLKGGAFSTTDVFSNNDILSQPINVTSCLSGNALFNIILSGTPLTYQWYRNGVPLSNSNNDTLFISNVSYNDTGSYYCKCVTTNSNFTSNTARLIILAPPANATSINGSNHICHGQTNVYYSVAPIANATSYIWTLPNGATGVSITNSIYVNFSDSAQSGIISVYGHNSCGDGLISTLNITVFHNLPDSAMVISGLTDVCFGLNNYNYTIFPIANAESYLWTIPTGASGTSSTNTITLNYSSNAQSGNISVKGHNVCGNGTESILPINVLSLIPGLITGMDSVNVGQDSVVYSIPVLANADSYIWTLSSGATGASSTNTIKVNFSNAAVSDTISVRGHNNCGDGPIVTKVITVVPAFQEQTGISLAPLQYSSAAWGDYNNDGYLDVLLIGDGTTICSKVYKNNGDNTFSEQNGITLTGLYSGSAEWGDYNNDGWLDILITGWNGNMGATKLYKNNGNNTFTEQTNMGLIGVVGGCAKWGDYNNDGWIDILIVGSSGSTKIAKVYANNKNNTFTEQTNISLTGVDAGSANWVDYNNDGFLDIMITGNVIGTNNISKLYKNNGNNTFTEQTGISFSGVYNSNVSWGDYNNDGWIDLLLTGYTGSSYVSKIYKNNGNNTFTEQTGISLTGVDLGSVAWGDYNNDGWLDILLSGFTGSSSIFKIYKNNKNNSFSEQSLIPLTGLYRSCVSWGDYDNDGDLDFLCSGAGVANVTKVYKNLSTTYNTPPATPTNLQSHYNGNNLNLSWGKSTDDHTPSNGLSYNIYMGSTPNSSNLLSPMTNIDNGFRRVVLLGNSSADTSIIVKLPPYPSFYWSVQAIDNAYKGGNFATANIVLNNYPPGLQATFVKDTNTSLDTNIISWVRGLGTACAVFIHQGETGQAFPLDNIIYNPNKEFGSGDQIASSGWYCVYNDTGTTVNITGLAFGTIYRVMVCEYNDFGAGPKYLIDTATNNPNNVQINQFMLQPLVLLSGSSCGRKTWGDFNNDGWLDINSKGQIYLNNGNKTFTLSSTLESGDDFAPGDANNDGYLDLFNPSSGYPYYYPMLYINNGDNTYSGGYQLNLTGASPGKCTLADFTNDGKRDGAIIGDEGTMVYCKLLQNNGSSINRFSLKQAWGTSLKNYGSCEFGDLNNDGWLDFFYTGISSSLSVFKNSNNGVDMSSYYIGSGASGKDAIWADYNNDGKLDILTSNGVLYRNDSANTTFIQNAAISLSYTNFGSIAIGDYNNDGLLDFMISDLGYTRLFKNKGNNTFSDELGFSLPANCNPSFADYDNDGDLDILYSDGNTLKLLENKTPYFNTLASAPPNVNAVVSGTDITFYWDKSNDNQTPQDGLSYNLYLFESGQNSFVRSPQADINSGFNRVAAIGNIQYTPGGYTLKGVIQPNKIYRWSIQAIDNGLMGGKFSAQHVITNFGVTIEPENTLACQGQNAMMKLTAIGPNINYKWYFDGIEIPGSNNDTLIIPNISALDTGNYYCKVYNTTDSSYSNTVKLGFQSLPGNALTICGPANICQGENHVNYITPSIQNASSYVWTLPNGTTGTSSTNNIWVDYGLSSLPGIITVKGQNTCGSGGTSFKAINVNPLPYSPSSISGDSTVCVGTNNVMYSVPLIANANSYIWTLPNGATGISTTNSILVNYSISAQSGNISVKGHNNCGDGPSSTFSVTLKPMPDDAQNISGTSPVCTGTNNVMYHITSIQNCLYYIWTLPNGASGQSLADSIFVNYSDSAQSGNITVKGHNDCGDGHLALLAITINHFPANAQKIVGDTNIYSGTNNVLYSVAGIQYADSILWTLPIGVFGNSLTNLILLNFSDSAQSGNITVRGKNACGLGAISIEAIHVSPSFKILNLHLFLEGLFNTLTNNMNEALDINWNSGITFAKYGAGIADKIQVDLYAQNPPYNYVVGYTDINLTTNGLASFQVPANINGNFYLKISTRNHLVVWSAIAVPFNTATINYDFTTLAANAYQAPGGNDPQIQIASGIFAFFLGDLDHSFSVDFDDFNLFEPYLTDGTFGFTIADFNGNGLVDFDDFNLFEPRLNQGPISQYPGMKKK
ncbi:MAG: FG-GAP-like repeat-containing protein [Bacteroidota bacterium]